MLGASFSILEIHWLFFDLIKEFKKELFNGLADWILDEDPNYPSLEECKLWIKNQNSQYKITNNDEKKILMLFTCLPISQQINKVLYEKYLDEILSK